MIHIRDRMQVDLPGNLPAIVRRAKRAVVERVRGLTETSALTQAAKARAIRAIEPLSYEKYDPKTQRLEETLTSIGNGYFGTRGILWPGTPVNLGQYDASYPATYLAGVYDEQATEVGGKQVLNDDMVNVPNWMSLQFKIGGGEWIDPAKLEVLEQKHSLNVAEGALETQLKVRDGKGRETLFEMQRIADINDPHRAYLISKVTPLNWSGEMTVRSGLDGRVENKGVKRYGDLASAHLDPLTSSPGKLTVRTKQSGIEIAEAERVRIDGRDVPMHATVEPMATFSETWVAAKQGVPFTVEKAVAIYTSRDGVDPAKAASSIAEAPSFAEARAAHGEAWRMRWEAARLSVEGRELGFAQKVLDLHAYHLLATASQHNREIDAGLPARGLNGESYRGHIFWDTCLIMRFFDHHAPEVSKPLLEYRTRRLDAAQKNAKIDGGYDGAMYPWQSGLDGSETTQTIHFNPNDGSWGPDDSRRQRHISFDIFYDAYNYWTRTGDDSFLKEGAEMMLQIAKFGASLAKLEKDGRYHIEGVMGPDEFHEGNHGLKDNAYTNLMVVWTLAKAQQIAKAVDPSLLEKIGVSAEDLTRWDDISRKMKVVIEDGIVGQFDGYFDLKELDFAAYEQKYDNIHRMDRILKAEGDSPDNYKVSKQADALMIFYMFPFDEVRELFARLGYPMDQEMLARNYDYYEPRTSHGSTLSKVVHCHLAHQLGREREAMDWYREVLASDIADVQGGTTPEGIHTGVMAGSIDFVVRGLAGMEARSDGSVRIEPRMPDGWDRVNVPPFQVRGRTLHVSATSDSVQVSVEGLKQGETQAVEIFGTKHSLKDGRDYIFERKRRAHQVRAQRGVESPLVDLGKRMAESAEVRRRIAGAILEGKGPHARDVRALERVLAAVSKMSDVSYEVAELEKDLIFLERGEAALRSHLARTNPGFEAEVAEGIAKLGGRKYQAFVTDRDGTINNYCSRYLTSVQSAYNAVFVARFAREKTERSLVLTAAPLDRGGLLEVSTMPHDAVSWAGSKGREWKSNGTSGATALPAEKEAAMEELNRALVRLLSRPENQKFTVIGSGLQQKRGETAIARQDIGRSIPQAEVDRFTGEVRSLVQRIDPEGTLFRLHEGNDIEINLTGDEGREYHKGDGLAHLDVQLRLDLSKGRNLIAGDTSSDIPMIEAALRASPDTVVAFVTQDASLADRVRALAPDAFICSSPDALVSVLGELGR